MVKRVVKLRILKTEKDEFRLNGGRDSIPSMEKHGHDPAPDRNVQRKFQGSVKHKAKTTTESRVNILRDEFNNIPHNLQSLVADQHSASQARYRAAKARRDKETGVAEGGNYESNLQRKGFSLCK